MSMVEPNPSKGCADIQSIFYPLEKKYSKAIIM